MISKLDISLIAGLAIAAALSIFCGFGLECGEVRGEVLRLHILAATDCADDQRDKLAVRDALLGQFGGQFALCADAAQAQELAGELLAEIESCANATLAACGSRYTASAELCRGFFSTREYEDGRILPAGEYAALRIIIGEGEGHNWWCVMFPPLCVGAACDSRELADIDALGGIAEPQLRFAAVEFAEKLRQRWK